MDADLQTRMDEMEKTLKELKAENKDLRESILGIGAAGSPSQSTGFMENKNLQEIIQEVQLQVQALNSRPYSRSYNYLQLVGQGRRNMGGNNRVSLHLDNESREELAEAYPVVEIRSKTLAEERIWMKKKFNEMIIHNTVTDGESLCGTTVEEIASSAPFVGSNDSSCTVKLSNFLDGALMNHQYRCWGAKRFSGPTEIAGGFSEVICFIGRMKECCSFMCSFAISKSLNITIRCYNNSYGHHSLFGIGFTPADIPLDHELDNALFRNPPLPDVWTSAQIKYREDTLEFFVSHGNLMARGHMTVGARSVVHVEIFEVKDIIGLSYPPPSPPENRQRITKSRVLNAISNIPARRLFENNTRLSCNIEIVNDLGVLLRNRGDIYYNSGTTDHISPVLCHPSQLFHSQRQTYFAEDLALIQVMFAYKIDTTDLTFVVALEVSRNGNEFATEFVPHRVAIDANKFGTLMDPNQWNTHVYRKYAKASSDMQLIQMRNIRAEISMTNKHQSHLKIRIFTV